MAKDKTPAPGYEVETLAVEAVRPLRHAVLRPGQPEDSVVYQSDDLDSAAHFGVRGEDGALIGIGSIHAENRVAGHPPHGTPGYRVRGMAVAPEHRGQGVGRAILARLLDVAQEAEAEEVWANARVGAISIYERSGFERRSSEFDIPTIGAHVVAVKTIKPPKRRTTPTSS